MPAFRLVVFGFCKCDARKYCTSPKLTPVSDCLFSDHSHSIMVRDVLFGPSPGFSTRTALAQYLYGLLTCR